MLYLSHTWKERKCVAVIYQLLVKKGERSFWIIFFFFFKVWCTHETGLVNSDVFKCKVWIGKKLDAFPVYYNLRQGGTLLHLHCALECTSREV